MCVQNVHAYDYPNGYRDITYGELVPCERALRGYPYCSNPTIFEHPPQPAYPTAPYVSQLPPTPQYSPLPSTPMYSGDESGGSHASSGSKKNKKRSSGIYVNGHKVLDLSRRDSRRGERIKVSDSPPTPLTPPQNWSEPAASYGESSRRHPVVVNKDRNTVQIEVVGSNERVSRSHSRHTSSSSHSSSDEEKRRRRREREKKHEDEELRKQRYHSRIARANAEIDVRPAVPQAPQVRRSSTYKRPAVEVRYDPEAEIARREEKARRKEEEAQLKRLKDRISVSPSGRRHRVMYEDGTYPWE